jgi:hypothetical protein
MRVLAFAGSKVVRIGIAVYTGRPMRSSILCAIVFFVCALPLCAQDTAMVRAADGFQYPVGPNGTAEGYYIARGYRPNGHLGEDWNGVHGGDTDLGDPVYACANGFVTFARNYHVGWGNVVILRHAYYEGSTLKYCDSLYGHLLDFSVQEGQQVRRGQQIGRIGNNFGMYEAHLHFEMRRNLQIGMFRGSFLRDFSNYYSPNQFVAEHHFCPNGNHMVSIPINTYPPVAPPVIAGPHVESPVFAVPVAGAPSHFARIAPLPPAGTSPLSTLTPAAKVITKIATPTPAPTTLEPRVAKSKMVAAAPPPTPTPAPTPIVKTFRTGASASSVANASITLPPSAKHATTITATSIAEPTVEITTAATTGTAASTPTTPAPSTMSSKATAAASSTSAPSAKRRKSTASVSTPAPAKKGARTPAPVAAAPEATPTPAPVAANKTRKVPSATPTPQPEVAARGESQIIASDPLLPAPTTKGAPIQRTGSTYKVDRFEDMRKAGD